MKYLILAVIMILEVFVFAIAFLIGIVEFLIISPFLLFLMVTHKIKGYLFPNGHGSKDKDVDISTIDKAIDIDKKQILQEINKYNIFNSFKPGGCDGCKDKKK